MSIIDAIPLPPDAAAVILHTSGSTGKPKSVVRSHLAVVATSHILRHHYNLKYQDVIGYFSLLGYSLYY